MQKVSKTGALQRENKRRKKSGKNVSYKYVNTLVISIYSCSLGILVP